MQPPRRDRREAPRGAEQAAKPQRGGGAVVKKMIDKLSRVFSRGSIRNTMFASFTISAIVAIFLTGVTLYARFSAQLDAAIGEQNQMLVDQVNQSLSTYLRDMIRLSDSISYNVVKNADIRESVLPERMRLLFNTYSDYVENMTFSEEEFYETEQRLNLLNRLKAKYGSTVKEILACKEEKQKERENGKKERERKR